MPKLSDDELLAVVRSELRSADPRQHGEVAAQAEENYRYFLGEPFGNEVKGRSSVVMTAAADTVESILPSLLRIFTTSDQVVKFEPVGAEDQDQAAQRTDLANHVFLRDNKGFRILYEWFKDALIVKRGYTKAWWQAGKQGQKERYEGLNDLAFQQLLEAPGLAVVEHDERIVNESDAESGMAVPSVLHDVTVRVTPRGKVCIETIPPEDVGISRDARSIEDARLVYHRVESTASDLKEEGYDADLIAQVPSAGAENRMEQSGRDASDRFGSGAGFFDESANAPMRRVVILECYLRVDRDGDGIAEMRKITLGGEGGDVLLDDEEWPDDRAPIYLLTPYPLPHRPFGLSVVDLVKDLQLIQSTLVRQMLDNQYVANTGRTAVDINRIIDLDDVLIARPNQVIRIDGPIGDALLPIPHAPLPAQAYGMLEYLDGVRENRTGVTRYNQGLDADSLNKTASGINAIMGAAQQRVELIARIFAETGVSELFEGIDRLLMMYEDRARTIRLRGEWVPIDPRDWKGKMDAVVTVGLGTGNKMEQLAHMQTVLALQKEMIAGGKAHMVTDANLYQSASKLVEASGLKSVELYFTDPANAPPPQPQPDPRMMQAQAEIEIKRMSAEADIALKRERQAAELQMQQEKLRAEIAMKAEELRLKGGLAVASANQKANLAERSARANGA